MIGRNGTASAILWRFSRNRIAASSLVLLVAVVIVSVIIPIAIPMSAEAMDTRNILGGLSANHWLGTDEVGRDVLARLLNGGRISLAVAIATAAISVSIGTLMGALSGYFGGLVDTVVMRITDALMSVPTFFLLLSVLSIFGTTMWNIVLVVSLTNWMATARLVRGEVLRVRSLEFVTAARTIGATDSRILFRHILPQATGAIVVSATLSVAYAVLIESSLSYLGLGIQPPTPSWGNMLANSQSYVWQDPLLAVFPGIMILVTVLSFNALGDGLRDLLDPYMRDARVS